MQDFCIILWQIIYIIFILYQIAKGVYLIAPEQNYCDYNQRHTNNASSSITVECCCKLCARNLVGGIWALHPYSYIRNCVNPVIHKALRVCGVFNYLQHPPH